MATTRIEPVRRAWVGRLLTFLGCALCLHASPAGARPRPMVPPALRATGASAPWGETDGFPPPRPFVSSRVAPGGPGDAPGEPAAWDPARGRRDQAVPGLRSGRRTVPDASRQTLAGPRHPVIHPRVPAVRHGRLFPRASAVARERRARQEAMLRHPAGRALGDRYVVSPGDTLWDLAERRVSGDAAVVADEVRRIHAANRAVIGPDPDVIRPGQVLHLPPASGERR